MGRIVCIACVLLAALAAQAATLEYLSIDDMVAKSTAIVRGRVLSASASPRGPLIYTHFRVQVLERWKGPEAAEIEVAVPGGSVQGRKQTFSGAPQLAEGVEYVLFLWTGRNGLTQVIGLSQGVFHLAKDASGEVVATRSGSTEPMLDPKTGQLIGDRAVRIRLRDLRARTGGAR
jgi:hypothetical protein